MRALVLGFAAWFGLSFSAVGQAPSDDAASLEGDWTASCGRFAEGALCMLSWVRVSDSDYLIVAYRVMAADGQRLFAGMGEYLPAADGFEGLWFDTNGSQHPLRATFSDGAMTTHWGRPETEEGRTRYALDKSGGLSVTDWVKVDGEWREFMHADYRRAGAVPE